MTEPKNSTGRRSNKTKRGKMVPELLTHLDEIFDKTKGGIYYQIFDDLDYAQKFKNEIQEQLKGYCVVEHKNGRVTIEVLENAYLAS